MKDEALHSQPNRNKDECLLACVTEEWHSDQKSARGAWKEINGPNLGGD